MRITLLSCSLVLCHVVNAQSGTVAAGGDAVGAGSVAWSLGQVACMVATGAGASLAQGVQQPVHDLGTSVPHAGVGPLISVFPTITHDLVTIVVGEGSTTPLRWELIDATGKATLEHGELRDRTEVSLAGVTAGVYFLVVRTPQGPLEVVKLIKCRNE